MTVILGYNPLIPTQYLLKEEPKLVYSSYAKQTISLPQASIYDQQTGKTSDPELLDSILTDNAWAQYTGKLTAEDLLSVKFNWKQEKRYLSPYQQFIALFYPDEEKFNDVHDEHGRFGSGGTEVQPQSVAIVHAAQLTVDVLKKDHADVLLAAQQGAFGKGLKAYVGDMTGNLRTAAVFHMQGFDGKPTIMNTAAFDAYVKGGATELMRGVSSETFAEQFKSGAYFAGEGIVGNGTYTAYGDGMSAVAQRYASLGAAAYGDMGAVLRLALAPDANVISLQDADSGYQQWARATSIALDNEENQSQRSLLKGADNLVHDQGTWAALQGYDAIRVEYNNFYIVLNRTAVAVDGGPKK